MVENPLRGEEPDNDRGVIAALIGLVRLVTLLIALLIWSVIGFVFWIPMMVYAIVRFSALVVYATIVDADPKTIGAHLERSVRFYLQGFRNIIRAIKGRQRWPSTGEEQFQVKPMVLIGHIMWTLLFWVGSWFLGVWIWSTFVSAPSTSAPYGKPTSTFGVPTSPFR
jgi:hypothetical protein